MGRASDVLGSCPPVTRGHCRLVFPLASTGSACLLDSPLSSLTLNLSLFAEALWCVASLCVILFTGLFYFLNSTYTLYHIVARMDILVWFLIFSN